MTAIYTNPSGQPVTQTSYSQRESFRFCPKQYELRYSKGWMRKEQKASKWFGKALESAIQAFEENGRQPGTGAGLFEQQWNRIKLLKEFSRLTYTKTEGSWESLLRAGCEMMMLYEIRLPSLPIAVRPRPQFQVPLKKQIFPGTELDVLTNKAYVDILAFPDVLHPALPSITADNVDSKRPLIIDIKTSGVDLEMDLVRLDPQLAEYAWQVRIPDVAFLWFVKRGHELKRDDQVALLQQVGGVPAGTTLYVLGFDEDESISNRVFLGNIGDLKELELATKGLRGKQLSQVKQTFFADPDILRCCTASVTKQRLQFVAVRLTETELDEVGRRVGFDTVQMVEAHRTGFYPKLGGIRFPNQKCNFCEMRGICLDRPELRDELLTRAGEEWLDGDED